jgi:fused signal recognition particle receptor
MVVGVNGVGKTTTIGKIAHQYSSQGKKILIGAADTFRAAAVEQLEIWATRVGADFIKQSKGSDPSAVAFDSIHAAKARNIDLVFIDTAGRLHTKTNLMEEIKKVKRIVGRECPGAPHEILLVLDATTGQNAISQAQLFSEAIGVTGIVLTKLDGTAKGGIIIGITEEMKIPIRYIGIGEEIDDLKEFNAEEFVHALF